MNALRQHTYGQALSPSKSPRDAEATILARITARMTAAEAHGRAGFNQLSAAISDNRRFWTAAAADLAGDGNALPVELRARLISIAGFVLAHSSKVLAGTATAAPLVEVNRAIIAGLSQAEAAA